MAIKDWPRPVRRVVGWLLITLAFAIAIAPAILTVRALNSATPHSWVSLLGGYALFITVPTTLVVTAFLALHALRTKPGNFALSVLMGTTIGIIVGLLLGLVTGGYSLLSAPAVGLLTFVAVWALKVTLPKPPPRAP